jgi:hypothetical protein
MTCRFIRRGVRRAVELIGRDGDWENAAPAIAVLTQEMCRLAETMADAAKAGATAPEKERESENLDLCPTG